MASVAADFFPGSKDFEALVSLFCPFLARPFEFEVSNEPLLTILFFLGGPTFFASSGAA
jgi:hypothetical protein